MSKSKILFMMTGSIACYKAASAISRFVQCDCEVKVVASEAAMKFIGAATLEGLSGHPVISDLYSPGNMMEHIHLMRWADLILVAPATANFINKMAHGLGDDILSTLFLAHDFTRPFLVVPAMNSSMLNHPLTQNSIQDLRSLGVEVLDTDSGNLACGENGPGRLPDPDIIVQKALEALKLFGKNPSLPVEKLDQDSPIKKLKILVTTGGTQEPIDTVRVLSNLSTGRTGIAIAQSLHIMGFDVTLLQSHASASRNHEIQNKEFFTSFESLDHQIKKLLSENQFTHIIHAAAVSDYSISEIEINGVKHKPFEFKKVSSDSENMSIHLKRNHKIVDRLRDYSANKDLKVIAFKLTSHASEEERQEAVEKLFKHSTADYVVHNDLTEIDLVNKNHFFTFHSPSEEIDCPSIDQLINHLTHILITENLSEADL